MNICQFVGKVWKKPEIKNTNSGLTYTKFFIIVSRNKGDETDFVSITAWRDMAMKAVNFLNKDDLVFVQGAYKSGKYEKDGRTVYTNDFVAKELQPLRTSLPTAKFEEDLVWDTTEDLDMPF